MPASVTRYALITGCSEGGIGYALAMEFQRRGVHVFATARNTAKMSSLTTLPNVTLLALDVTVPASIAAAVEAVRTQTGGTLDYLVNNSGSQYVMSLLDLDVEKARAMFDVNVWGVILVTQAFAGFVIKAKGSIVNMGSIAGLIYPPFMGVYSATKSATHTISETLRLELKPLGVKVVTVVTGSIGTNIFNNAEIDPLPETSHYKAAEKEFDTRSKGTDVAKHSDVNGFAKDLVGDVIGGVSGKVYRGAMSSMIHYATSCLPTGVTDQLIAHGTGLDKITS